jgi:hypothetical protein
MMKRVLKRRGVPLRGVRKLRRNKLMLMSWSLRLSIRVEKRRMKKKRQSHHRRRVMKKRREGLKMKMRMKIMQSSPSSAQGAPIEQADQ